MKLRIENRRLAPGCKPVMVICEPTTGEILPGQYETTSFTQGGDGEQYVTVTFKVGGDVELAPTQPATQGPRLHPVNDN